MNELIRDLTVRPQPYFHMVVRRRHPILHRYRFACLCGYRSGWTANGHQADHPDHVVTVSRLDLTPIPHPSNGVQS